MTNVTEPTTETDALVERLRAVNRSSLDENSAGTGTVMRPDTVRAYAAQAGFGRIDVLPIEHDFWRFYRLVP